MHRRTLLLSALASTAGRAAPTGPVLRIIVATPPGGASDTAARQLAQPLARSLGQAVVVENKPGGLGVPAIQALLSAPADGHTLLWAQSAMAGLPLLLAASPIRAMGEFAPIVQVVQIVYGLFVHPAVPAATLAAFSAHLKAHADRLSYGTGTLGEYMAVVHYLDAIGARAHRVPYKGGVQLMPDLIRGELQFNIGPLAPALPHVRSGRLRLLATLPERSGAAPGVPSFAEAGLPLPGVPLWNGLVAPPGTPRARREALAEAVNRALAEGELRQALETQGLRPAGGTPQQMADHIEVASLAWRQFVREHGIPPE